VQTVQYIPDLVAIVQFYCIYKGVIANADEKIRYCKKIYFDKKLIDIEKKYF